MSAFSKERRNRKTLLVDKPNRKDLNWENPVLRELEFALTKLASLGLTALQKRILLELYLNGNGDRTLSSLVRELSAKLNVPESTMKWSVRKLREAGLLLSGDVSRKGLPVLLTYAGLIVSRRLSKEMAEVPIDG
ncbi:MAG: hypothetical protein QFX33_00905 [Candidatus Nezhaarchaeota archaeon]|nr:hypothetical protein [Candidatus Nezhaarchaeota archaeon]